MGILETAKDVARIVQQLDNVQLIKAISELQVQCYDLVFENRELKEQLIKVKEALETKERLQFRKNAYWFTDSETVEDGPLCSRCWDTGKKVLRMTRQEDSGYAFCPECKNGFAIGPGTFNEPLRRPNDGHDY